MRKAYRQFLLAVGIFGAGAFAHTLLILLATQRLTPRLGAVGATSAAVTLYVLHNIFYASFFYVSGSLSLCLQWPAAISGVLLYAIWRDPSAQYLA
jgi:hypothetical protein